MTVRAVSRRTTTTLAVVMVCVVLAAAALAFAAPSAGATGPHNAFLAVQVGDNGQFNIGAYPAADGSDTTGSWDLSFSWPGSPWSSFTTVRVDGSDYKYGTDGTQVAPPTDVSATKNSSAWQTTPDIQVTQQLSLVTNSATGRQDVAQIAYTVKNTGSVSHSVGVRLMVDTEINYNDSALFRVPGVGALTVERDFTGAAVPRGVYVFDTPTDTTHIALVACGFAGAAPNRMVIAYWPTIDSSTWDYTVDTARTFGDSAYAMYWNPTTLAAGQSRTYVSSYGLGASNVNLEPPLALGVYGPSQLSVVDGGYSPNPFDVSAWVSDIGTGPASNVTATLTLSAGLQLASGLQTQSLGALAVNEEKQASWSVSALPQGSAGTASYSVTVVADGIQPKTVTRTLALPAVVATTVTSFLPASGPVGTVVTLTGTNFTGATKVAFNGAAATTFNVVDPTQITATVPAGATTGTIAVTTPVGSATSATSFTVTPQPPVAATVTLKLSGLTRGAITLGKRVTAKGKVTPTSLAGTYVKLKVQKKKSGRWVTVKTKSRLISATGTYSWTYKPLRKGAYRMRAQIAQTATHTAAKTVWRKFKVT